MPELKNELQKLYLKARNLEKRIYSDEILSRLPLIESGHVHEKEWKIRQISFRRLENHIKKKNSPLSILEIGCGNGWLSNKLSLITNCKVTGIDLNDKEVDQAKRVFRYNQNVNFIYGDLATDLDRTIKYNVIVIAATIQYVKDPVNLIKQLLTILHSDGEIHILDSPFYSKGEVSAAKKRSADYYARLGVPELNNYYHHHLLEILLPLEPHFFYNPNLTGNRFKKIIGLTASLFPWFIIKILK